MKNKTVQMGKFKLGVNNVAPDNDLPKNSLVSAVNVDVDKEGNLSTRPGSTKIYSGSKIHSLYDRYFAEGTDLKLLNPDNTATIIKSGLSPDSFLSYCDINGDTCYSDGKNNYVIGKGTLGIKTPPSHPGISVTTGMLDAGLYHLTFCYRNQYGEISGAELSSEITVPQGSGLMLTNIPVSPEGYDVIICLSEANGEEIYRNAVIPNGLTAYAIISTDSNGKALDTQFMEPIPAGHILRTLNGRLYVANGSTLWFSQAMRYGLHKPSEDYFNFPEKITIVQSVTNGLFIVSDKTYYLDGVDPSNMTLRVVSDDKAIPGTGITVGGAAFDSIELEENIEVGFWFSTKGAVLGIPGGSTKQLTENRLAINDDMQSGVSMLKEIDGIRQMITNFSNKGTQSDFSFGAQATSQIIRNGIVIN